MIIEIIDRWKNNKRALKDSASKMVRYISDLYGGNTPEKWQRDENYTLLKRTENKVISEKTTSCLNDDVGDAALEIMAVQAQNTTSTTDKQYHIVVSLFPGEKVDRDVFAEIEDRIAESLGMSEHQRISAIHNDTDKLHMHIVINKIHPRSFNNIEPYYPKHRMMELASVLEKQYGLKQTVHTPKKEKERRHKSEQNAGFLSFETWIKTTAKKAIQDVLSHGDSWETLHTVFAQYDLEIKPRGAGLVIASASNSKLMVKASSIDRSLSLKALQGRFGNFQTPIARNVSIIDKYNYHIINKEQIKVCYKNRLYDRYQKLYQSNSAIKKQEKAKIWESFFSSKKELKQWYKNKRQLIKVSHLKPLEKRLEHKKLFGQMTTDFLKRREMLSKQIESLNQNYPVISWIDFLRMEAQAGDAQALKALRKRGHDIEGLNIESSVAADSVMIDHPKRSIMKNGHVIYYQQDGGIVIDAKQQININHLSTEAVELSLMLAMQKYTGQPLKITGTDEFKRMVLQVAKQHSEIVFEDPKLQQLHEKRLWQQDDIKETKRGKDGHLTR